MKETLEKLQRAGFTIPEILAICAGLRQMANATEGELLRTYGTIAREAARQMLKQEEVE